jgi:CDP-diacylglycerol--serine O-phosphatidyltransferase
MLFSGKSTTRRHAIPGNSNAIAVIPSPALFKEQLLELIRTAKKRIYLTALYLQDDDAGRALLSEVYRAKQINPELVVKIFVDYHRGQRGLIGEQESLGNRALYLSLEEKYPDAIDIYGVPVKNREIFGVLHLKGFVIDDTLLYTGASINDLYLQWHDKYRLDRYYQITNKALADTLVNFNEQLFVQSGLVPKLNLRQLPRKGQLKHNIQRLKTRLRKSAYIPVRKNSEQGEITLTPLIGFGLRKNQLNKEIHQLFRGANQSLVIFTPYFNLPKTLLRDLKNALRRGVQVDLVVGDKTANDFFIPPSQKFTTIGIIPYIYETLLTRFVRRFQPYIDAGLLNIHLWCDGENSFHLKGVVVDDSRHLITGSNLNPRAWGLDLENGIVIDDPGKKLLAKWQQEYVEICLNTKRVSGLADIESAKEYPAKVQELLRKLKISQIDHLLKRLL